MHILCLQTSILICIRAYSFSDVNDATFEVNIESDTGRVRRRTESTHLGRGLVLYQYRPFDDYESIKVSVRYKGRHVGESPYVVPNVFHENCACPLIGVEAWLENHECGEVDEQILKDLVHFRENGVNISDLYDRAGRAYERNSFVHYSIVDGKVSQNLMYATFMLKPDFTSLVGIPLY